MPISMGGAKFATTAYLRLPKASVDLDHGYADAVTSRRSLIFNLISAKMPPRRDGLKAAAAAATD